MKLRTLPNWMRTLVVAVGLLSGWAAWGTLSAQQPANGDFDRTAFSDVGRRQCEQDPFYKELGASNEQIAVYCQCYATKLADSVTSAEFREYENTKVLPPSVGKKAAEAAETCKDALGLETARRPQADVDHALEAKEILERLALVLSVSVAGIYLLTAKDKKAFMQAWGRNLLTDPEVMMWAVIFLITMLCLWWDVGIQLWALVSFGVGTAVWLYFRRLKRRKSTGESNPPSPN